MNRLRLLVARLGKRTRRWPAVLPASLGRRARLAPPMLPGRRLHTQLLISFALVALVALAAGGAAVVWLMIGYRTQATTERLRDAAVSAGAAAFALQRQGLAPSEVATAVAAQVPLPAAHVLLLDSTGTVVTDQPVASPADAPVGQSGTFLGRRLEVPAAEEVPPFGSTFFGGRHESPPDHVVVWRARPALPSSGGYIFVAAGAPPPPPERGALFRGTPPVVYRLVLAIPQQSLPSAWRELAPGLAVATAIALLAAAVVAWWLAGSIARPIRAVTDATRRIARGEPHQPIPERGVEEVTELAQGFNAMVAAVERSQRTLRDFVANASHELRTPLTAIQGFSQAVVDGVLEAPEPTRDAARLILREAERMRHLVEDLLLLSKIEARDRPMARDPVDVAELLDLLAQRLLLVVRERGLQLRLELPERLLALGDAAQLEHLFGNLLDNAAKYAPDGATITVRAALDGREPPQATRPPHPRARGARLVNARPPRVVVAVHNTGSYIPPEDLPHVFDRFYRVDKSRSRAIPGSGLGLAIAREVVERHGGTIHAESDPAAGTTFVVTLPAAPVPPTLPLLVPPAIVTAARAAPAAPPEAAGAAGDGTAGRGLRRLALHAMWHRSLPPRQQAIASGSGGARQ